MKRERVFGGKIDEAKNKWSPRSRMDEADRARISSECLSSQVKTSLPFFLFLPLSLALVEIQRIPHMRKWWAPFTTILLFFFCPGDDLLREGSFNSLLGHFHLTVITRPDPGVLSLVSNSLVSAGLSFWASLLYTAGFISVSHSSADYRTLRHRS